VFLICLDHRLDPQYGCDGEEGDHGDHHKDNDISVPLVVGHSLSDPEGDGDGENNADDASV